MSVMPLNSMLRRPGSMEFSADAAGRDLRHGELMIDRRSVVCLCLFVVLTGAAHAVDPIDIGATTDPQLVREIADRNVVFYATDISTGERFAYQPQAADVRHAPWSTFKIPNLLIAIETGAAPSLSHERLWDQHRRPAESYWSNDWKQNQTLETAFRRSAAWYFQDIARDIGSARYRNLLKDFGYGNVAIPDDSDSFWLGGPLAISPREQVEFLERLVLGQLDVKRGTTDALRSVSVLSDTGGYVLRGKTGSGPVAPGEYGGAFEGWLVGWVEKPDAGVVVFALYVDGPSFESISGFRYQMSALFLRSIGALPMQ